MHCPFCRHIETKVVDSRLANQGEQVRRRRECCACAARFTTFEIAELNFPYVVKRDGRRALFSEEKLRAGFLKALEKRPVSLEAIENAILRIKRQLLANGEPEIVSSRIGEWVMQELLQLDQVAYIRFASVYQSFEDIEAFRDAIQIIRERGTS